MAYLIKTLVISKDEFFEYFSDKILPMEYCIRHDGKCEGGVFPRQSLRSDIVKVLEEKYGEFDEIFVENYCEGMGF